MKPVSGSMQNVEQQMFEINEKIMENI
jgi:hypothetical protein